MKTFETNKERVQALMTLLDIAEVLSVTGDEEAAMVVEACLEDFYDALVVWMTQKESIVHIQALSKGVQNI